MEVGDAMRVLIVEDNLLNMELATDVLEAAGYQVCQAWNAEDGMDLARRERPDVVLMDVGLPGMDGLTAARLLKADPQTAVLPVVALTAHAMSGDRERALEAGCDGYVSKPIDTRTLAAAVAGYARGRNA